MGFISETGIDYRSSSIVKDFSGDGYLWAGDRLPDLTLKHHENATLLENWTEARHLALLLEPSAADIAEIKEGLPLALLMTVRRNNLDEEGLRALGSNPKFLIVRPDGYIGFRGIVEPHMPWTEYAEQDALAPSNRMAFR